MPGNVAINFNDLLDATSSFYKQTSLLIQKPNLVLLN